MLLRDQVYHAIRRAILTWELRPGEEVREHTLADRYRVSRSPVRDALLRLSQERLVTVLPRQGYRINPITISDARDVHSLRRLIEAACAAAAARCDDASARRLDAFRYQSDQISRYENYIDYNADFHRTIAQLGDQMRIAALACDLTEQVARSQQLFLDRWGWEQMEEMFLDHNKIIDAIQSHDPRLAFEQALAHVQRSGSRLINAFPPDGEPQLDTPDRDGLEALCGCVVRG